VSDGTLVGTCHCGQARIRLPRKPAEVTHCNCTLCSKSGFQGVYFPSEELQIEGDFDSYVRADSSPAYISQHRCRNCGIITHWTPLTDPPHERMGVNARLFEADLLADVPVKQVDGRSWPL